ncbi:hypothetical protein WIS52_15355 [Pseudonocardia nematodicida]|uniref:Uncharacterized protein n=1 Tax=Pseudonocardia nematodicida TaxID=1206997 RepID=A0ABV1KBJ9_9PSEU
MELLLTSLLVIPGVALLGLMAAHPLFELWDAVASERTAKAAARDAAGAAECTPVRPAPVTVATPADDVTDLRNRIPAQRRPRAVVPARA